LCFLSLRLEFGADVVPDRLLEGRLSARVVKRLEDTFNDLVQIVASLWGIEG